MVLGRVRAFTTGNGAKVKPMNRIDDREPPPRPIVRNARELDRQFARETAFKAPTKA